MKSNIKLRTCAVASAILLMSTAFSQTDTVRVKETTVVHDDHHDDDAGFLRGEVGLRYMPTFNRISVRNYNNEVVSGSLSMSHGWGAMVGFNFTRHIGIMGEIDYLQVNQKWKDKNLDRVVELSYINFPIMLQFNTDKMAPVNVNFVVGPQFGLNIGSSVRTTGSADADVVQATVAAKKGDAGAAYGVGLEFGLNKEHSLRLDVGFRGYLGFLDISGGQTNNNPDTYNVLLKAGRTSYAGYLGLAYMF
jgi:hypothetical protein